MFPPRPQTFDSDGALVEDPEMQALEVFCSCWFTFEVSLRKPQTLWGGSRFKTQLGLSPSGSLSLRGGDTAAPRA